MLEFLNKTDLTVAENIILAVITTVICSMMIPYIWKLCKLLFKYIYNKFKSFIKYLIRLKKGKLTIRELIEIENKLKAGEKVSKRKLSIYNKETEGMKEALKDIKMPDLNNLIPPQYFK